MTMPVPVRWFPEQASSMAERVDALFTFLTTFSLSLALVLALAIVYFSLRYRRRPGHLRGAPIRGNLGIELLWIAVPLPIALYMFYQGAKVYFALASPPPDSLEVYVIAKQWMWKFQHPEGPLEIDELHVPVGRDLKLILATEDVIHSFYVPAFRIKTDVVPGRYQTVWFRPIKPGRYRLFCAEYCGTNHSGMGGQVIAMPPAEYQAWLTGGRTTGSVAADGEKLFQQLGCTTCHLGAMQGRGPMLQGLFGQRVPLRSGQTVIADESYLRESILLPQAQIVAGFEPIMPSFAGLLSEPQVLQLVAYVKSLGPPVVSEPQLLATPNQIEQDR